MKSLLASLSNKTSSVKKFSSDAYWSKRYESDGNSGPGSYRHLAQFKAYVLNRFVAENGVTSVIEFGCGDGNQLALAHYPLYIGIDVSETAVTICQQRFSDDASKRFLHVFGYQGQKADLSISLDVIFHLVEDDVFDAYMNRLFDASMKFVIIYSSNQDESIEPVAKHVRHRKFSTWIDRHAPHWKLIQRISNPYPYNGDSTRTSFADFFIYALI